MKIWAFDPKNCRKMLFLALISQNIDFSWKLGVKPEPLRHSGGSLRKKNPCKKLWKLAHILMRRAQNAAPRQQWTSPMTITPKVAPIANQAFETSQFTFFLKHPNSTSWIYNLTILFMRAVMTPSNLQQKDDQKVELVDEANVSAAMQHHSYTLNSVITNY